MTNFRLFPPSPSWSPSRLKVHLREMGLQIWFGSWGVGHSDPKPARSEHKNLSATLLLRREQRVLKPTTTAKTWKSFQTPLLQRNNSYPSPVRAQHAWMCHWWSLIEVSFRNWEISATVIHSLTSCLLAKISKPAFFKSLGGRKKKRR